MVAASEEKLAAARTSFCLGQKTEAAWKNSIFRILRAAEYAESTRDILVSLRNLSVARFNVMDEDGDIFGPYVGDVGMAVDRFAAIAEQDVQDMVVGAIVDFADDSLPDIVDFTAKVLGAAIKRLRDGGTVGKDEIDLIMHEVVTEQGNAHELYEKDAVKAMADLLALLSLASDALKADAEEFEMKAVPGITMNVVMDMTAGKRVIVLKWSGL